MYIFLIAIFILAPTYQWRFKLAGLPVNFLEILLTVFFVSFLVWIYGRGEKKIFWNFVKARGWWINLLIGLFALAGIISAIISPNHHRALGQLADYFIQPILAYYSAAYILQSGDEQERERKRLVFVRVIFVLAAIFSAYAIFQYFTLIGVPPQWWGNTIEPKRALSVFEYPNAYALWLDNLLAFCLPFVFSKQFGSWKFKLLYLVSLGGLLLSFSRGGWLALLGATVIFALFFVDKEFAGISGRKIKTVILGIFAILVGIVFYYPNLRYRVILPFMGDKSTLTRFSLARDAIAMIKTSPILGKGLYGFFTYYHKFNVDLTLPAPLNYPHDLFLNFWVETGLLGLLSFLLISATFIWRSWKNYRQKKNSLYAVGLILFFIAIYIHGLDDVPYFLNNLALTFWMVLALGGDYRASQE